MYCINAKDLYEDEIDYELSIRSHPTDEPFDSKRRTLRKLLRQPEDPNVTIHSHYSFDSDYVSIPLILDQIENFIREGLSTGCLSRLVHYHKRTRRYVPQSDKQRDQQRGLLYIINQIARNYYAVDFCEASFMVPTVRIVTWPISRTATSVVNFQQPPTSQQIEVNRTNPFHDDLATGGSQDVHSSRRDVQPDGFALESEGAVGGISPPSPLTVNAPLGVLRGRRSDFPGHAVNPVVETRRQSAPGSLGSRQLGRQQDPTCYSGEQPDGAGQEPRETSPARLRTDFLARRYSSLVSGGSNPPPNSAASRFIGEGSRGIGATSSPAPQDPERDRRMEREYVHASEIESYIRAYLERFWSEEQQRPVVQNTDVNQLVDQIANVGLQDMEVSRISRAVPRPATPVISDPVPPLQLSSHDQNRRNLERNGISFENRHQTARNSPEQRQTPYGPVHGAHPQEYPGTVIDPAAYPVTSGPQMLTRRLPHQQCNIIEKWPKFSGDNNHIHVTDFLRQIDMLCRSYAISKQDLRMHAHLLFKDSAYIWYTTYEDRFDSWATLEGYLKMRYDNPNRDRIVREEIRNRKQRPNELFSAFLADIEMLAQRLNHKMSEREKFDLIVENMKISYKRRLALEPIHSIEHLAQLCYKFDALEPNLYSVGGHPKPIVQQLLVEEEWDEEASEHLEQIYALQKRAGKFSRVPTDPTKPPKEQRPDSNSEVSSSPLLCWNCRQTGHMWKDCEKRKEIFCHVCGHLDTTAYRCPNKHNLSPRGEEASKNE